MIEYRNRHKEQTFRDNNMVPDSVSRVELDEALAFVEKANAECAEMRGDWERKCDEVKKISGDLAMLQYEYDMLEKQKIKLENAIADLLKHQDYMAEKFQDLTSTFEKSSSAQQINILDLTNKVSEQKREIEIYKTKNETLFQEKEESASKISMLTQQHNEDAKKLAVLKKLTRENDYLKKRLESMAAGGSSASGDGTGQGIAEMYLEKQPSISEHYL